MDGTEGLIFVVRATVNGNTAGIKTPPLRALLLAANFVREGATDVRIEVTAEAPK